MTGLVDRQGRPLSSARMKKDSPPKQGNAFAPWAGRENEQMAQLPGGSLVQFDLTKLKLEDFRTMRDHYQVNASLAVLSFLQHQTEFTIECSDKKIASAVEDQLNSIWTQLNKALATANWAGFSPNALDWENNNLTDKMEITKVKDLKPEECEVNWKEEEGWAPPDRTPPKYKIYDGIKYFPQRGWPIPLENSFWYPLLMEHGDYYGRKLLRPAFQSWFFSILVHLFANRYFERFGEPVPVGRAPFEEEVDVDGVRVKGNKYLLSVLRDLRNRSVVVLPNDRSPVGANGQTEFDYEIEYLESQMRGADFERYLTRLDEEISIGLFTPILLLRTADVGSYNLGVGHLQVYQWMMNSLNDDRAMHIDKYIISKFINYNFSPNAPRAKIKFRKLGNTDNDLIKQVLVALVSGGTAKVDLNELGSLAGLTLTQVKQLTAPPADPAAPATGGGQGGAGGGTGNKSANNLAVTQSTIKEIVDRVETQVNKAFRDHTFNSDLEINMGFKRRIQKELEASGVLNAQDLTERLYTRMDTWMQDAVSLGEDEFSGSESFVELFNRVLGNEFAEVAKRASKDN